MGKHVRVIFLESINANLKKMVICYSGLFFTDSRELSSLPVNINDFSY